MPLSLYQATVPALAGMLTTMQGWLDKAAAQGDEAALLGARLAPDMHPLPRQFQIASDGAKGMVARLAGIDAPSMPDTEATFADLKARCDKTIAFVQSVDPAAIEAGADREIVLTFPNGGGMRFDGITFLTGFALPNFYFHATTAYAILRAHGVGLGKVDYLASLAPHMFAPSAPATA